MDVWDSRSYKNSSTESIVNIIDNIFRLINFIWNGEHFPKKIDTAMSTKSAPFYAFIFNGGDEKGHSLKF